MGRVVRSGAGRRRVQSAVIGLAAAMAVTSAVLGGALLVASQAPFDDAFAAQRGAHLTVQFDGTRDAAAQTATAPGVTAAAGPFPTASLTPEFDGRSLAPMTVVGRTGPGGAVDDVTLTQGQWTTGPGEIVLSADGEIAVPPGNSVRFPELPGAPTLTVVGLARSISHTADAWVPPELLPVAHFQMLYRFSAAATAEQVDADRAAVAAKAPGAVRGAQSWLTVRQAAVRATALFVPFLTAFGVLGLVMSVLVVGNVVAGAVGAGTRRIGVLKALGFTPGQVVRAYIGQALIPAGVGIVLGVAAGNALAVPVLHETQEAYEVAGLAVPLWVDAVVAAGALAVVALTAWASAWRAGRLRTVDALAVGHTPPAGRGRWAARLASRSALPQPVGLGLARPFSRPARALAMFAAAGFGATAVTFAIGLSSSLLAVQTARDHDITDVSVGAPVPEPGARPTEDRPVTDPAAVAAAIAAQPGTRASYGVAHGAATVAGVTGSAPVTSFTGDASWGGYELTAGRWLSGPGEAVVPTAFLTATGTHVGDPVTLYVQGEAVTVRLVGEVFDTRHDGMTVYTALPKLRPDTFYVSLRPGTDLAAYVAALNPALRGLGVTADAAPPAGGSGQIAVLSALTAFLSLLLVAVAGLGVLNGVVLDTRERVRDLGICKALGMTPRQTLTMVLASAGVAGLAGGLAGVPAGTALHAAILPAMGRAAGVTLPPSAFTVYGPGELVLLALGGLVIAFLGALLPAGWAARTRTATALRTE
ncbi:FtsX-like permease family protein [Amycolatopsis sp. NPDC088138]|uniref:ABC transporter permease n=1 Tax=Amycolatopsis sp. NPDC088138 TaxID=3363938 RepID=UPI00382FFBE2